MCYLAVYPRKRFRELPKELVRRDDSRIVVRNGQPVYIGSISTDDFRFRLLRPVFRQLSWIVIPRLDLENAIVKRLPISGEKEYVYQISREFDECAPGGGQWCVVKTLFLAVCSATDPARNVRFVLYSIKI